MRQERRICAYPRDSWMLEDSPSLNFVKKGEGMVRRSILSEARHIYLKEPATGGRVCIRDL
jgi:hypothetical protein